MFAYKRALNFFILEKCTPKRLIKSTVLIIAFFDFFNRITKKRVSFWQRKQGAKKTTFNNKRNVSGDEMR